MTNSEPSVVGLTWGEGTQREGIVNLTDSSLIAVQGVAEVQYVASRYADSAAAVSLQPGVPAEVLLSWTFLPEDVPSGELTFEIWNGTRTGGQWFISERQTYEARDDVAATLTVVPEPTSAEEDE